MKNVKLLIKILENILSALPVVNILLAMQIESSWLALDL